MRNVRQSPKDRSRRCDSQRTVSHGKHITLVTEQRPSNFAYKCKRPFKKSCFCFYGSCRNQLRLKSASKTIFSAKLSPLMRIRQNSCPNAREDTDINSKKTNRYTTPERHFRINRQANKRQDRCAAAAPVQVHRFCTDAPIKCSSLLLCSRKHGFP